jgi:hypothetical protein
MPHPTSWKFTLILFLNIRLYLPSGLCLSAPFQNPSVSLLSSYLLHGQHIIPLHLITLLSSANHEAACYFCFTLPVTPSVLYLFSITLILRCSFSVSNQVLHSYTTTEKNCSCV